MHVLSCFSHVRLFATPQASLSMEFSKQEYLPFPLPGDLPDLQIQPVPLMSPALAGGFFNTSAIYYFSNIQL